MFASVSFRTSLAILVALTIACGESAGPEVAPGVVPGTFVLRRVAGDPLPTVLYNNEIFATLVVSDTIRLRPDGTGTISGVREAVPLQPGLVGDGPVHILTNFHFRRVGGQVEITYDCPPGALCIKPPHLIARPQPGGLTVRWGHADSGRSPMIYEEVGAHD
jgi:hypothetical protein